VKVDPRAISSDAAYQWIAATIVPRPIAWVSTLNPDGSANLAPFSFFTGASVDPPTCIICVSRKSRATPRQAPGEPQLAGASPAPRARDPLGGPNTQGDQRDKKDTWANIERTGEYVIHVVPDALAQTMNVTSKELPRGADEFVVAGLAKAASERVAPPRVAEAPVAMECRLHQLVEVGAPGDGTAVIIGEILLWHVRDELLVAGRIDFGRLDVVARMGGAAYARTRERFEMPRPK
jgi:flavin reductase (DIM6/NTAB) family NADH-FMN oxidoreductase RutF